MNDLLIGFLGAVLATNQPAALSNLVREQTGLSVSIPDPNDPAEKEYREILILDEVALQEIDDWIQKSQKSKAESSPIEEALLQSRIKEKLAEVKRAYEDFLRRHPQHARAHLAYGSFLGEAAGEHEAAEQYEKARALDPTLPAAWNNLANYYGHNGSIKKSFEYYAKAIELKPNEPVYYHNLATTVFMFRKDAREYYDITEEEVFNKAMDLYHRSLQLDPNNFILATDVARTYYGIRLNKTGDESKDREAEHDLAKKMLAAWEYAMKLARDDAERQGILIHYARAQLMLGNFDLARSHLNGITNAMFTALKQRVMERIDREDPSGQPKEP